MCLYIPKLEFVYCVIILMCQNRKKESYIAFRKYFHDAQNGQRCVPCEYFMNPNTKPVINGGNISEITRK